MALLANVEPIVQLAEAKLIVRNTFWDFYSDDTTEEFPYRPRSYSDPCIHYADLDHKDDFSDSTTVAGTSDAGSVVGSDLKADSSDSTTIAGTSRAGSVVDSNDVESCADMMSGPPGVFTAPGRWKASSVTSCHAHQAGGACTLSAEDKPTVVMVRNIPGDASHSAFLEALDAAGFAQMYNFVYVPMNFQWGNRLGYAILNFVEPASAAAAVLNLSGMEFGGNQLTASLSDSKQCLSDLILKYRDSAVMHSSVSDDCKPVIFAEGLVVPFPEPTKVLEPPILAKPNRNKQGVRAAQANQGVGAASPSQPRC